MSTETYLQILIICLIVLIIVLIVAAVKLYQILMDIKYSTAIGRRRAKEFDSYIDKAEESFKEMSSSIKGFVAAITTFKGIKEKIEDFIQNKNERK